MSSKNLVLKSPTEDRAGTGTYELRQNAFLPPRTDLQNPEVFSLTWTQSCWLINHAGASWPQLLAHSFCGVWMSHPGRYKRSEPTESRATPRAAAANKQISLHRHWAPGASQHARSRLPMQTHSKDLDAAAEVCSGSARRAKLLFSGIVLDTVSEQR